MEYRSYHNMLVAFVNKINYLQNCYLSSNWVFVDTPMPFVLLPLKAKQMTVCSMLIHRLCYSVLGVWCSFLVFKSSFNMFQTVVCLRKCLITTFVNLQFWNEQPYEISYLIFDWNVCDRFYIETVSLRYG